MWKAACGTTVTRFWHDLTQTSFCSWSDSSFGEVTVAVTSAEQMLDIVEKDKVVKSIADRFEAGVAAGWDKDSASALFDELYRAAGLSLDQGAQAADSTPVVRRMIAPPGQFYVTDQARQCISVTPVPCPAGFYCSGGDATARGCSKGTLCPMGSSRPKPCPPGFFCPFPALFEIPCMPGTHCARNTVWPKACPPGSFCPHLHLDAAQRLGSYKVRVLGVRPAPRIPSGAATSQESYYAGRSKRRPL